MSDEERSLARVEAGPRTPDLYERKYMTGEGLVMHRAKAKAPKWLQAMLLLPAGAMIPVAFFATGGWLAAAITLPLAFLMWVLFSVLRVTVSEHHVNIQYGLFGPKIPIRAIESAEATTYDWMKFGGWGIKRSIDGEWIYNMPGDRGRAVRIVWRNAKGRRRVTLIGSKEHHELARAIDEARGAADRTSLPQDPARRALTNGMGEPDHD